MKRMFVLGALLLAASACAPADQGAGGNSNLAANNANRATPQASPAAVSDADIIAVDRQIWDAIKAKNWDAFAAALADDAVTVTGGGVSDKAQTVEAVKKLDLTDYALSDVKVLKLDADAAVITYTSTSKARYDGQPMPDTPSRDSTVFVRRGGKWLAAFHQETPAEPSAAPPAAPSNSNAAANSNSATPPAAAASPAPAPASATDAEQQVWDALKRKDWNAFAGFLADEQLEVEPGGVHTKAESVESASQFNFSSATLSDFRELKLDADAAVVTYIVKGRGRDWPPDGFRSSSVWVNRGGKWLAVFHQATAVTR